MDGQPSDGKSVSREDALLDTGKLASGSGSGAGGSGTSTEPPRLAVVTDIQIPHHFDFPTSPPPGSSSPAKPRYNAAVLDEFDPLAKTVLPGAPTPQSAQRPDPPSSATPTSAPATIATFPSITSIARSFISRPSSPASATRPDQTNSPKRGGNALPPQSPATRTKPTHASALSTSTTTEPANQGQGQSHNPPPDPEQFDFPRFLDQLKSRPADPVAKYLRR
jgi:hypothetical protein